MSKQPEPQLTSLSMGSLTNLQALGTPRYWNRWCPDCHTETKHRATAICDQGTLAHCSRCRKRVLTQGATP
jgi:hypothetical protein